MPYSVGEDHAFPQSWHALWLYFILCCNWGCTFKWIRWSVQMLAVTFAWLLKTLLQICEISFVLAATCWTTHPVVTCHSVCAFGHSMDSAANVFFPWRKFSHTHSGFIWYYVPRNIGTSGQKGVNTLERHHCRLVVGFLEGGDYVFIFFPLIFAIAQNSLLDLETLSYFSGLQIIKQTLPVEWQK